MADPVKTNILKSGAVSWLAPEGEALPDSKLSAGANWGGNWQKMGFTKEPVKLGYEDEEHDIEVEEYLMAVARKKIGEKASIETVLAELTADYLQLGLDGSVTSVIADVDQPGYEDLQVGNTTEKKEFTLGFEGIRYDAQGNALPFRFGLRLCTIHLNGELKFSRRDDDYTGVSLQAEALTPVDGTRPIWFQRITAPAKVAA